MRLRKKQMLLDRRKREGFEMSKENQTWSQTKFYSWIILGLLIIGFSLNAFWTGQTHAMLKSTQPVVPEGFEKYIQKSCVGNTCLICNHFWEQNDSICSVYQNGELILQQDKKPSEIMPKKQEPLGELIILGKTGAYAITKNSKDCQGAD